MYVLQANTVLFACGTDESCAYAAEHLGSTAPADSVLQLSASALSADRGKLQQQLAGFLREEPQGVVVVKGLDRLNPALLPVLINGMSEQGAYQHGGRSVAASGATFLLTWKAPQAVMAEVRPMFCCFFAPRNSQLVGICGGGLPPRLVV